MVSPYHAWNTTQQKDTHYHTHNSLDESERHYAEAKKPVPKVMYPDSVYMTFSKSPNYSDREQFSRCQGLRLRDRTAQGVSGGREGAGS